jgi:hypothetical protein
MRPRSIPVAGRGRTLARAAEHRPTLRSLSAAVSSCAQFTVVLIPALHETRQHVNHNLAIGMTTKMHKRRKTKATSQILPEDFSPNAEVRTGGTAYQAVPSGYQPDGTGRTRRWSTDVRKSEGAHPHPERLVAARHRPVACATPGKSCRHFGATGLVHLMGRHSPPATVRRTPMLCAFCVFLWPVNGGF